MSLAELHNNVSLYSSPEEFEKTGLKNPKKIDDDIAQEKQQFSKLKFQYLEQETRDKFLRIILSNSPIQITDDDLSKIQDEAGELKSGLKELKQQMTAKQTEIDALSEEFLQKEAEFKQKYQAADALLADVQAMEKEYAEIIKGLDLEVMEVIDAVNIDEATNIQDIRDRQSEVLQEQRNTLETVILEIKRKERLNEDQIKTIETLTKQLRELMITSMSENTDDVSTNNLGKWMNEMNNMLIKFFGKKLQISVTDDIKISLQDKTVVLDKETFNLKSSSGDLDADTFNNSTSEARLASLVAYLLQI